MQSLSQHTSPAPQKRQATRDLSGEKEQKPLKTEVPRPNPHKALPSARAAQHSASSSPSSRHGSFYMPIPQRPAGSPATTPTELYTATTQEDGAVFPHAQYQTPPPHPSITYGVPAITQARTDEISPHGGSRHIVAADTSTARIAAAPFAEGGQTSAFKATFTSPGKTGYPAVAIYTDHPTKTVTSHPTAFGHLRIVQIPQGGYVTLSKQGITLKDAVEKIKDDPNLPKYKLACLLSYFPSMIDKLSLIEDSGHAHEDIKPENLVIWGPGDAGPIDMRDLPRIETYKKTFSIGYTSPGTQLRRPASSLSDVFATGRSISIGLAVFQASFAEIPGLPELLIDLEKARDARPALAMFKDRLETCLQDFKAINPEEYDTQLAAIHELVFAEPFGA